MRRKVNMFSQKNFSQEKEWYLGLDIGTDSVGWAATNTAYNMLKYRGNATWGVQLFDGAGQAAERRGFRTARRRLDRRGQRIVLLQELFAKEISRVDEKFFIRLKESALYAEDKSTGTVMLFNDTGFTDRDYHQKYPTVHHLIMDLIENKEPHDIRLVYLACAYMLAHRGHFLSEVDKENIDNVTDFNVVYNRFTDWFDSAEIKRPWECDTVELSGVLKRRLGITAKDRAIKELLSLTVYDEEEPCVSPTVIIKLLAGGKANISDLFLKEGYKELEKNSICLAAADFGDILDALASSLDDGDADLLYALKGIYDWSLLSETLSGFKYISQAKIKTYDEHTRDLRFLKKIIKKYIPDKYNEVFRQKNQFNNYVRYSYNLKDIDEPIENSYEKASREDFCKYISALVKDIAVEECDKAEYDAMREKLALALFCPMQVNSDNRVIPYQLYWQELKAVLDNAAEYLDFLNAADEYGSVKKKILSIMEFRIPYFVGPLVSERKSDNAWLQRKAEGRIYPWNFEDMVDLDRCEAEFIGRMVGMCTYLAGESVLPKNSLLYAKYTVLNEINNIRVNGEAISVEAKQRIYTELFEKYRNVTVKKIKDFLLANSYMAGGDILSGLDITIKSSLRPQHDFAALIKSGALSGEQVEKIIEQMTYTEDKRRLEKWLDKNFKLPRNDVRYISKLKYKDFGRLSRTLLERTYQIDNSTGELIEKNLISMLWETNDNLMQLLSGAYGFKSFIENRNREFYSNNPTDLTKRLDEMYISNAVKRPILRTLDIVKELKGIIGCSPKKVFVEMARGEQEGKSTKGKRTKSRREQINEYYAGFGENEVRHLREQLAAKGDSEMRSEKLFLYFMQLGKCMYCGETIDIEQLGNDAIYNVDHIFPQAKIKDDSLDNKVLVHSSENGAKGDTYPIVPDIRAKMSGYWDTLKGKGLISERKYLRLKRNTPFTDEELADFINRQLVETRQSTKAVAELLGELLPETEIVYVKAGLVSEFRHEFDMHKCREINDLHHAKDAYLNIVVGNAYNVMFTKSPINFIKDKKPYSMKPQKMVEHDIERGGVVAWKKNSTMATVKHFVNEKNNIRLVKYSFRRKGGLFNQNPEKKSDSSVLVQRKKGLDTAKYGGYNKTTASYFALVKYYSEKGTMGVAVIPIELLIASKYEKDIAFAEEYALRVLSGIIKLKNNDSFIRVEFPLGKRIFKVNTLLEIDGLRLLMGGKAGGGKYIIAKIFASLVVDKKMHDYIKCLASYCEKSEKGNKFSVSEKNDKITVEENLELYSLICKKLGSRPFVVKTADISANLEDYRENFVKLSVTEQAVVLLNVVNLLKTCRANTCDLTAIGGKGQMGALKINANLSSLKGIKEIYIIDQSPTGLYEKKSDNLLKL